MYLSSCQAFTCSLYHQISTPSSIPTCNAFEFGTCMRAVEYKGQRWTVAVVGCLGEGVRADVCHQLKGGGRGEVVANQTKNLPC